VYAVSVASLVITVFVCLEFYAYIICLLSFPDLAATSTVLPMHSIPAYLVVCPLVHTRPFSHHQDSIPSTPASVMQGNQLCSWMLSCIAVSHYEAAEAVAEEVFLLGDLSEQALKFTPLFCTLIYMTDM
jgi:hypothetical protein